MKPTILVVEDDETLRYLVCEALSVLDLEVIECSTADRALHLLQKGRQVSLVLTDIRMPGRLDGLELARLICLHWPDIPVILTSGHMNPTTDKLPPQAAFMSKPWTLDQLHRIVIERLSAAH